MIRRICGLLLLALLCFLLPVVLWLVFREKMVPSIRVTPGRFTKNCLRDYISCKYAEDLKRVQVSIQPF